MTEHHAPARQRRMGRPPKPYKTRTIRVPIDLIPAINAMKRGYVDDGLHEGPGLGAVLLVNGEVKLCLDNSPTVRIKGGALVVFGKLANNPRGLSVFVRE